VALIVQLPLVESATVEPETVQTGRVDEAKLTARPEDAVALTVIGGLPTTVSGIVAKKIVCEACTTLKL
jgi:bifunctional DNase/RNase